MAPLMPTYGAVDADVDERKGLCDFFGAYHLRAFVLKRCSEIEREQELVLYQQDGLTLERHEYTRFHERP